MLLKFHKQLLCNDRYEDDVCYIETLLGFLIGCNRKNSLFCSVLKELRQIIILLEVFAVMKTVVLIIVIMIIRRIDID